RSSYLRLRLATSYRLVRLSIVRPGAPPTPQPSRPSSSAHFPSAFRLCQRGDVPLHAGEPGALDGALPKQSRKIGLLVMQQVADRCSAILIARRECRMRGGRGVIPRTDFLADVAPEGVAGQRDVRQLAAVLDGRV